MNCLYLPLLAWVVEYLPLLASNCLSQVLALEKFYPQVATRLFGSFNTWRRYDARCRQVPLMTIDV